MDLTGLGSAFSFAQGMMDRFFPKKATEEEKLAAVTGLAEMVEDRDTKTVEGQRDIIVAEMMQGDNYTKRARPTLVYVGLAAMVVNNVILPFVIDMIMIFYALNHFTPEQLKKLSDVGNYDMPGEFWVAWGGAVSIWSIGRSVERRGIVGKMLSMVTGNKR